MNQTSPASPVDIHLPPTTDLDLSYLVEEAMRNANPTHEADVAQPEL